ncbi:MULTISPECIES: hypothetical protein [Pseudanabaena]|uniref:hypothetical protein n=1 Tax=Pseudanabaena TaxID=1152 RepID=UPI0024797AED|nr:MULTISPECIES: hypothetical protein [Pseudanabaena]MEA5487469.1 hypothetical protein [Pseudanabaena sp. CCNP1317]WGS74054.1 hypothetical protein OA858_08510 [Pseudanabaena galeata CCNP1313]
METTTTLHSATLHNNVKPRLKELIKQAECLRMAVAYWTIPNDYFGDDLIEVLKKKDSFACVDISLPTDIDELCKLAKQSCNLYFYTESLVWDGTDKKPTNRNLLHSKVLLFDLPDDLASIWIGSHNWTDRSLIGKNIETSLEICVDKNSDIYTEIKYLLEKIKQDCEQIIPDPLHERIYKITRRQEDSLFYLRANCIESPEHPLLSTSFIHLILDNNKPNSKIFPEGKKMVFLMNSLQSNKQFLLHGEVYNSGGLRASNKKATEFQTFDDGYYCLRQGKRFVDFRLKPDKETFENIIRDFHHYATFVIGDDIQEINANNFDSHFSSKYETPITLLNEFTQFEFMNDRWQKSESFELKKGDKAIKQDLDNRDTDEIENVYDDEDNAEKSIWRLLDNLHFCGSFQIEEGSKLDAILKVISPSEEKVLIKKQLVNDTEKDNKIHRIRRGLISKIVKKRD